MVYSVTRGPVRLGLQKTSLVDFPGRVAAVFFLPGCNFSCPYCHNPELVFPTDSSALVPLKEAFEYLRLRLGLITALVISGGEPTLFQALPELVAEAQALGLQVKVDTNGSFPERIAAAGANYLALDLKTAPERYPELLKGCQTTGPGTDGLGERIRQSVRIVRHSGAAYEFRITCVPGIFGPAEAQAVAGLLEPEDPVVLQPYRSGRVLDPAWASGVRPYTDSEMKALLELLRLRAPLARIRGMS